MRDRHKTFSTAALFGALALSGCSERETVKTPSAAPGGTTSSAMVPDDDAPRLAPGLWRVATTSDGQSQEMSMCLDEAVQARMSAFGATASAGACEETRMTREAGGGWRTRSICDMGPGGRMVSDGVVTGDFRSIYRSEWTTVTSGAALAQMNGETSSVAEGRLVGPCPADMRPGDADIAGMRVNMAEMADQAAARAGAGAP
ncbi:DUF3617 domain-containing protein [Brevundimonas lutea]|uniref:DUF3617 domain-containing protein n=1 Tax=Brevundimonas lutea TaxID=2293980 RepID=UPI000F011D10|nr:DUF3617 family protein [Brevundimonas lutea]